MEPYVEQRLESLERTVRGFNGDEGVVSRQRIVMAEQKQQALALANHQTMLCDPKDGINTRVALLEEFMVVARDFIADFRKQSTQLILAVLATVIGGLVLQLALNYVMTKGQVP